MIKPLVLASAILIALPSGFGLADATLTTASNQRSVISDKSLVAAASKDSESNYISYSRPSQPTVGLGLGLGLNIYPTMRLESGFHGRDKAGFISLAFETASFSKSHVLACALLLDSFNRDLDERRLMLNYRGTSEVYIHLFVGYENKKVKLLKAISDESDQLKNIITASKQSYIFGTSLGSRFSFLNARLNVDWLGLSFSKKVRSPSFINKSADATDEEVQSAKNEFNSESGFSMRFLNIGAFLDL